MEERRKLVDEKTEHTNRLTSHLKIYFPQMLNWFEHLDFSTSRGKGIICHLAA